jgi:hypothetical protein
MPTLSVVIPVFRNELSFEENLATVKDVVNECRTEVAYEAILVSDTSSLEDSLLALEQIHSPHPEATGTVNLTRNPGQVPLTLKTMWVS